MTVIVRKLEQRRPWDESPTSRLDEIQADVLNSLITDDNKLSVFELDQSEEQECRLIAALAIKRHHIVTLDIVNISKDVLAACGIEHEKVCGGTLDSVVNNWHLDLVDLTVSKMIQFVIRIKQEGDFKRYTKPSVEEAIRESVNKNQITTGMLGEKMRASLIKRGIIPSD